MCLFATWQITSITGENLMTQLESGIGRKEIVCFLLWQDVGSCKSSWK